MITFDSVPVGTKLSNPPAIWRKDESGWVCEVSGHGWNEGETYSKYSPFTEEWRVLFPKEESFSKLYLILKS